MRGAITLHTKKDFEHMREAGRLAAQILDFITPYIKEGVTTDDLNTLCHNEIIKLDAIPAPLNYMGFPKSVCISVNEVICHGIPSARKLKSGDILNIDVTVIYNGWYGDTSRMYYVGDVSEKAKRLVNAAYKAMILGIEQVKPKATMGDIGSAIQTYVERLGFSVVKDFCGHGIGMTFHAPPTVLHFGKPNSGAKLKPGMIFTIEPMINAGSYHCEVLSDDWTAVTRDGSLSAQFEHTIGVTDDGFEIFTLSPNGYNFPPYE